MQMETEGQNCEPPNMPQQSHPQQPPLRISVPFIPPLPLLALCFYAFDRVFLERPLPSPLLSPHAFLMLIARLRLSQYCRLMSSATFSFAILFEQELIFIVKEGTLSKRKLGRIGQLLGALFAPLTCKK
jgi:hypothetical protein